ncbi:hypothetical protein VD0002_g9358 [Verticillium dahliae]|uniref:Uncharacterized protein n=1 Tax=Verticillium dahliae TaxID=27337 RepID=A0A2J8C2L7_VERDA|nr:hypothetical protein BJF96_g5587 [Verticillium dahliae]PNH37224.1 hypothetical protein VD0004_g9558 [Verticillium dahliae]PNH43544.1 hypothetical protein VD0003_g9599 [Verticillium dahliae]PNH58164.1 hypothetical protein VD0002_g9358 [Verticillium dahliae]PNH62027.1 hypothetical protein VD0001_g9565 [Verticillium dahliae]
MPTIQVSPDADELLQSVANGILKSRKIIVVTGAGISTNSGIPDFRSENGLYALIQAQFDAANKDPKSPTALTRSNSSTSVGLTESHEDGPPTKRRKLEQTDDTMRQASPGAASSQTQDDQVECLRNGDYVKIESLHAEEPMPRQMTEDHGFITPIAKTPAVFALLYTPGLALNTKANAPALYVFTFVISFGK